MIVSTKLHHVSNKLPDKAQKVKKLLKDLAFECEHLEGMVLQQQHPEDDDFTLINQCDSFSIISINSSIIDQDEVKSISSSSSFLSMKSIKSESPLPTYEEISKELNPQVEILALKNELNSMKQELKQTNAELVKSKPMWSSYQHLKEMPKTMPLDLEAGFAPTKTPFQLLTSDIRQLVPWTSKYLPYDCFLSPARIAMCYIALLHVFVLFLITHRVF